jgi:hypothetical protein
VEWLCPYRKASPSSVRALTTSVVKAVTNSVGAVPLNAVAHQGGPKGSS